MTIAVYIKDSVTQLVLTPTSKHEEAALALLHNPDMQVETLHGSFYETRGGWYREGSDDKSTMLVIKPKPITGGTVQ